MKEKLIIFYASDTMLSDIYIFIFFFIIIIIG